MLIDTEAKKNAFRDFMKSRMQTEFAAGNIKNGIIEIKGIIVPEEDTENYSYTP